MRPEKHALLLLVVVSVVALCHAVRRRGSDRDRLRRRLEDGKFGAGEALGRRRRYFGRQRTRMGLSRKIVHRTSSVSVSVSTISEENSGEIDKEMRVGKEESEDKEEENRRVIEEDKMAAHRKRLRALLSPEARRLPRPVASTTTEQPKDELTELPGEFHCPNTTESEGAWRAFSSPSSCRLYYICVDGLEPREHGCSQGKVFNQNTQVCDEPERVDGCEDFYQKKARDEETREDKGIGDGGLDRDEQKQYFVEFVDMLRRSGLFKRGLIDLLAKGVA